MFLFESLVSLARILVIGVLAYIGLLLVQRISGKRTLSKMNAFDLVVTVALGSALATIILNKDVQLLEGLMAFVVLMGLQYVATWLSVRSERVRKLVKLEPSIVFYKGQFLHETMRRQRVVEEEILQAIRSSGLAALKEAEAVVLETNGDFSVIRQEVENDGSALANITKPEIG